jgi:hypothetical protein
MSSRVINIIKEVINEMPKIVSPEEKAKREADKKAEKEKKKADKSANKEKEAADLKADIEQNGAYSARLISIPGHERKIPYVFNMEGSLWSRGAEGYIAARIANPRPNEEEMEIKNAIEKNNVSIKDIEVGEEVKRFKDKGDSIGWKEEIGRAGGKRGESLSSISKLPVYKIKDEDWKEYSTKSTVGSQYKKGPIKPMAGDDIAKQDQGLGKDFKDADAPKRDSDYVSPNKDTTDVDLSRDSTKTIIDKTLGDNGKLPYMRNVLDKAKKKVNEDDSNVSDDEIKALKGDRSVKLGLDDVPGDTNVDDVSGDDSAAEAGKEERVKTHKYIKASSFKKYAQLYPELNNPNQKIVDKSPTKVSSPTRISDEKNKEEYYKILDPKRFMKVSNDAQLVSVKDPYAKGSAEAKLRSDLEGATPEEKRAIMAKYKGKDAPSKSSTEKKSNPAKGPEFKTPVGKSGNPMVSKGKRNVQVRESILNIIKQVIKEETSK